MTSKLLNKLAPILGAGAVGACPLCWAGSASLLTYLGLGTLIPIWRGIAFTLLIIGLVGFMLDYRSHRNPLPVILLAIGGLLLYLGRYVYGGPGFGGWPIWGLGGILVIVAVTINKRMFNPSEGRHQHAQTTQKV